MTDRYVVMSSDDARRVNLPGAPEEPRSGWDADYDVLVDTARNVIVYYDFCVANAPEEMYLDRRLSTFVDELNRLASEAASTAAEETTSELESAAFALYEADTVVGVYIDTHMHSWSQVEYERLCDARDAAMLPILRWVERARATAAEEGK